MSIASIRSKMKDEEFAEVDKCPHITYDHTEIETDRDLETFSDDLFKYLFPRRLNVDYCSKLERTQKERISNFHPHIGKSVLCGSYSLQKTIFLEILENKLEVQNTNSIAYYFTNKAFKLHSINEYVVFQKLKILAAITLELSVFCHLQGNENAIHYNVGLYFSAFKYIFKDDFYRNGGWIAWKDSVSDDLKFYEENQCEFPPADRRSIHDRGWLNRFDWWIARLYLKPSHDQTEQTLANSISGNKSGDAKNFKDATSRTTYDSEKKPTIITEADNVTCLISKDCPRAKQFQKMSNQIMLFLIEIMSKKDSAYEELYQIIEDDTQVKKLMRYCILPRMILAKSSKMRCTDILQCAKLILKNYIPAAVFCFIVVIQMYDELEKAQSFKQDSRGKIYVTEENLNRQETNSNTKSVESLSLTKESNSSLYQENNHLIDSFINKIKTDKLCADSISEICKILSNEGNAEVLLTYKSFKLIMETTVQWARDRWEDKWMLSVMTFIINNSQTNALINQSTEDGTKTEYLANEIVDTDPQVVNSLSGNMTITAKSLVLSISDRKDVENLHKNKSSFKVCRQCFNSVEEKLKLVKYYPATLEISFPENETNVKHKKKHTQKKRNGSVKEIINETVDKETSSATKSSDTAVVDLPPTDLYSEVTTKDIQQTQECKTDNPEKEVGKVGKLCHSQLAKYRESNEIPFSPEDNVGTTHKAQTEDETHVEVASCSQIACLFNILNDKSNVLELLDDIINRFET